MKRHKYVFSFAIVAGLGFHTVNHGVNAQEVGAKDTKIIEHFPSRECWTIQQLKSESKAVYRGSFDFNLVEI